MSAYKYKKIVKKAKFIFFPNNFQFPLPLHSPFPLGRLIAQVIFKV